MTVNNRVENGFASVAKPPVHAQRAGAEPLTPQAVSVQPTISGQLLPSRSLRALKAVLDRYRQQEAA
jgi:hypothetical protein